MSPSAATAACAAATSSVDIARLARNTGKDGDRFGTVAWHKPGTVAAQRRVTVSVLPNVYFAKKAAHMCRRRGAPRQLHVYYELAMHSTNA